jgi:dienelactone hydrolase
MARRLIALPRRARVAALAVLAVLVLRPVAAQPAAPGAPVTLPSLDGGLALPGRWFPAAGAAPAPAFVLLHGCSGVLAARGGLAARYTEMAALLNALGVHALVLDSLAPRGERELCTQAVGKRRVTQQQRRRDALGALAWLAAQPGVDGSRLGLLGWSNGGSTALAASNLRHPEVAAARVPPALAVAYYPGCESELGRGYRPAAPLLMLLGEADDWTPAAPCKALAAAADTTAAPRPQWQAYAEAHHGFDGSGPVRHRSDVPGGARPGAGVHVGGQPAARAASRERLAAFVREHWKLAP